MLSKQTLPDGFYTALGTPVNSQGEFLERGLLPQMEMQYEADAAGFLLMGSMGMLPVLRDRDYPAIVKAAVDINRGRKPLFVGAMDNSLCRIRNKIDSIRNFDIDGIVLTTPYYFTTNQRNLLEFFRAVADSSPYPVYLYDLPSATKIKMDFSLVKGLAFHPNIAGIKTGDLSLARKLNQDPELNQFQVIFSGLDVFDLAYRCGIQRNLDGMFACTPKNAKKLFQLMKEKHWAEAGRTLDAIVKLRDLMASYDIFPSFTYAMNLIGCPGRYHPDFELEISEEIGEQIRTCLIEIGEI